jgi:hypothetical protein
MLLVPADVLHPRRPDAHFAAEATVARDLGCVVAVVDHDALARGDAAAAVARVPSGTDAVYRGWMLSAERYAGFTAALTDRGVYPRTGPDQYRRGHELPGWYRELAPFTPRSEWTDGTGREAFTAACARLGSGPAVLRDYTMSMKHHWDEAAYVPDVADTDRAWKVACRFRELRDDEFSGGYVLRRFEDLTGSEVRTWWIGGVCALVTAHPDTPDAAPEADVDPSVIAPAVASLGLPFVTVDLALRADGVWRVVEAGDGQVSDRPASTAPETLVAALSASPD